jgi:hypothetical protein
LGFLAEEAAQKGHPGLFSISKVEARPGALDATKEQPPAHKGRKVKEDVYAVSGEKRRLLCLLASAHLAHSDRIEPNTQTLA